MRFMRIISIILVIFLLSHSSLWATKNLVVRLDGNVFNAIKVKKVETKISKKKKVRIIYAIYR